ncbi:hypothetical protein ACR6C2_16915 [Streptomyces sp. INA 01156]
MNKCSEGKRTVLLTFEADEKDKAWNECMKHASELKRMKKTKRYGVTVRTVKVPGGKQYWLEMIDRGVK